MSSGLTEYGAEQALIALLPNGTSRYVGLFTTVPTARDGTGGVEASGSGYARVGHSAWVNATESGVSKRKNNGAITFAALTADLSDVEGWGIWDASSGGNLLAFGKTRDSGGVEKVYDFLNGDQPRFADQDLKVGIDEPQWLS